MSQSFEVGQTADRIRLREKYTREEDSFFEFTRDVVGFPDLDPILHRQVCKFLVDGLEAEEDITMLLLPRKHLKSSVTSISFPQYLWMLINACSIQLMHGKKDSGKKYLGELKGYVLRKINALRFMAPDVFPADPRHHKDVEWLSEYVVMLRDMPDKAPSLLVNGVDGDDTGLHFNIQLLDDLVTKQNYRTRGERNKVYNVIRSQIPMRKPFIGPSGKLVPGKIFIVGTRWHKDDAYGRLLDPKGEHAGQIRAMVMDCYDKNGEPIYPLREGKKMGHTKKTLEADKKNMGSALFNATMRNKPTLKKDAYFDTRQARRFMMSPDGSIPAPGKRWIFTACDPNNNTTLGGDAGVTMTAICTEDGGLWVVDILRGRPSITTLIFWMVDSVRRWDSSALLIESVGFQNQLQHPLRQAMLREGIQCEVIPVKRGGRNSLSKQERISSLRFPLEAGGLHVREGADGDCLLSELSTFQPEVRDQEDDQLDCLADIYELARERITVVDGTKPKSPEVRLEDSIMRELGIAPDGRSFESLSGAMRWP